MKTKTKRFILILLSVILLVSLTLPVLTACSKDEDKEKDGKKEENQTIADVKDDNKNDSKDDAAPDGGDNGDNKDNKNEEEKEPEPIPEPTPEPGADVPEGGVLKKYDFADGTLQGIEAEEEAASLGSLDGKNMMQAGYQFTGGWELILFEFPMDDVPLLLKAKSIKYDVLVHKSDVDKAGYVEFTPALKTDWGKWWEEKLISQKGKVQERSYNDDYYIFTVEWDLVIEMNGEWLPFNTEDTFFLSFGIVFNGLTTENPLYISDIEFIK